MLEEIAEKEKSLNDLKQQQQKLQEKTGIVMPDKDINRLASELDKLRTMAQEKQNKIRNMMEPPSSSPRPGSRPNSSASGFVQDSLPSNNKSVVIFDLEGKLVHEKEGFTLSLEKDALRGGDTDKIIYDLEGKVANKKLDYTLSQKQDAQSLGYKDKTLPIGARTKADEKGETLFDLDAKMRGKTQNAATSWHDVDGASKRTSSTPPTEAPRLFYQTAKSDSGYPDFDESLQLEVVPLSSQLNESLPPNYLAPSTKNSPFYQVKLIFTYRNSCTEM